jgi:hypothetical protein
MIWISEAKSRDINCLWWWLAMTCSWHTLCSTDLTCYESFLKHLIGKFALYENWIMNTFNVVWETRWKKSFSIHFHVFYETIQLSNIIPLTPKKKVMQRQWTYCLTCNWPWLHYHGNYINFSTNIVSGHYLKIPSCLYFKTSFGNQILSPFSGKPYSVGPNQ